MITLGKTKRPYLDQSQLKSKSLHLLGREVKIGERLHWTELLALGYDAAANAFRNHRLGFVAPNDNLNKATRH